MEENREVTELGFITPDSHSPQRQVALCTGQGSASSGLSVPIWEGSSLPGANYKLVRVW
jgi:hypothetical protein